MAERAHITSFEALESFRTSLILYVSKARPTLDEVQANVVRTRLWLQNDQRLYWENQLRRRRQVLEQAQQALMSARMSNLPQAILVEQIAAQKAKRALEEAEFKLKEVKQWTREFDSRVESLAKHLEKLRSLLTIDMPNAAAYLNQAFESLTAYAEMATGSAVPSPSEIPRTVENSPPAGPARTKPLATDHSNQD